MTPQEALEAIKIEQIQIEGKAVRMANFFEGLHIANNALEKQIPKKPIKKTEFSSYEYVSYRCPICNQHFLSKVEGEFVAGTKPKYCYNCGQALDWSDTK